MFLPLSEESIQAESRNTAGAEPSHLPQSWDRMSFLLSQLHPPSETASYLKRHLSDLLVSPTLPRRTKGPRELLIMYMTAPDG